MENKSRTWCGYRLYPKLSKAILLTSLLISAKSLGQTDSSFTINPKLTKTILNNYGERSVIIHPVIQKLIETRKAYVLQDTLVDLNTFSGNFIQFPDKYYLVLASKGQYVENELLTESEANGVRHPENGYYLIQMEGAQQFYFVMSNVYLSNLQQGQQSQELLDLVHKLGYKEYKEGEDFYIKSKTSEIRLDAQTLKLLKENQAYITTLDNDQTKINGLIQQTKSHTKTLDSYLGIYKIKKSKTPVATITLWKTATTNAQKLANQIYKLKEKYDGNYSVMPLDKSNTYETFLDNLNASKGILGM